MVIRGLNRPLQLTYRSEDPSDFDPGAATVRTVSVSGQVWGESQRDDRTGDGTITQSSATCALPVGTATDTLTEVHDVLSGQRWQVDGAPMVMRSPFRRHAPTSHIEVRLRAGV